MKITYNTIDKVFGAKPCSVDTMQLKGYELVDELFVDSSGFGLESEPALTVSSFESRLKELLKEYPNGLTAKITNAGMFQVYVGLFQKTGKKIARKIANNTLYIEYPNGKKAIRLHDTDIITENGDGTITLNTGGYDTRTTRARMNQFSTAHVYGQNFGTYADSIELVPSATIEGAIRL